MQKQSLLFLLTITLSLISLFALSCNKNREADWKCECDAAYTQPDSAGNYNGYSATTIRYEVVTKSIAEVRCKEESERRSKIQSGSKCKLSKVK